MEVKAYFKESHAHFSNAEKIILSDEKSTADFEYSVFVIIEDKRTMEELFSLQINCEYYCSLFRNIVTWNEYVVIGFDNYGYLFNTITKKITSHKLNSYFSNFHIADSHILICSLSHINCFDGYGDFIWRSDKLGAEKVVINNVVAGTIYGSGDWGDDSWKDFKVNFSKISYNQVERNTPNRKKLKGFLAGIRKKALAAF